MEDRLLNNKDDANDELVQIDLNQLFIMIKKNMRLIILTTILCAIIAFLYTTFFVDKKYASSESIYLTPKVSEKGDVDSTTINTNNLLINNYMAMIKTENVLSKVAEQLSLPSAGSIGGTLSVSNTVETQIIVVQSTTDDPIKAKQIVETTVDVFFSEMKDNLNIQNMTILEKAKINSAPVSPNRRTNTILGAIVGIIISGGYVFLKYMFDKRLKNRNEAESFLGIPVLAEIPIYEE